MEFLIVFVKGVVVFFFCKSSKNIFFTVFYEDTVQLFLRSFRFSSKNSKNLKNTITLFKELGSPIKIEVKNKY